MRSHISIQVRIAGTAGICLGVIALFMIFTEIYSSRRTQRETNKTVTESVQNLTLTSLGNLAGEQAGIIQARFDS